MVLILVTLAQRGQVSPTIGYGGGGAIAVVVMVLAYLRYKQRKANGE